MRSCEHGQVLTTTSCLGLAPTIVTIATISWSYQLAGAAGSRLCDILDLETCHRQSMTKTCRFIEFDHVSFPMERQPKRCRPQLTRHGQRFDRASAPKDNACPLIAGFTILISAHQIGGWISGVCETPRPTRSLCFARRPTPQHINRRKHSTGQAEASRDDVIKLQRWHRFTTISSVCQSYASILGTDTKLSGGQEQGLLLPERS